MQNLLSFLIWLPIIAGLFVLYIGDDDNPNSARYIALFTVLLTLALCLPLIMQFNYGTHQMQFVEFSQWLPQIGVYYHLGVDGIAVPLIVLSVFTTLIVLLATWHSITQKVAQYLAAFLIMQGLLVGVFSSMNAVLFYIFFEATLIPMYLIIGVWGSDNRIYAAIKFFLYTLLGSLLMLVALLYLGSKGNSFTIAVLYDLPLTFTAQILIFIAFFFGFAIKVPMWPVHTWLPDAHTEAPAGGSIVLAAVLLKLGGYGFLRFAMPIVPDAANYLAWVMIALSLIGIIYIAIVAIVQTDMKKLIAYSSISHMGFVTLGCFAVFIITQRTGSAMDASLALEGAYFVMISHGFISGALFAGVGFLYERMHTRQIADFGGVVNTMPVFASFMMLFAMANAGLPGTSGFVGEFMVIVGTIKVNFWVAFAAATTLIFGAAYTLWMYKRVIFGKVMSQQVEQLQDIQGLELVAFVLLAAFVLFLGIYPAPLLDMIHESIHHLLTVSSVSKL
jgi:NADH-quinone oxidoreductase subunit M